MTNIDAKYESWKNKLLDLGKRNRLLNYKETKIGTLRITSPEYRALYNLFVKDEQEIVFPLPNYEDEMPTDDDNESSGAGGTISGETDYGGNGSFIRTNRPVNELQRVLRNLRNKAKVSIEEQGINILYLCFGFLKYTEAVQSNTSFVAPLVMVPVKLSQESIVDPFILTLSDDEIVVNPTLAYKLKSDFALDLPEFDASTTDIGSFLDSIEIAFKDSNWSVERDVGLTLLSYLKISMYEDLKEHADSISDHPFVKALCGDNSALVRIPDDIKDYDFDKNDKPQNVFQIVDADSSQQEAILYAKRGISFILQGPPGTGKSQTITNIIAERLAEGKKVLFVSEKMAALEVVYKRITEAGLADFCLVLHSQKTSKRNILDQLEQVLKLSEKKSKMKDEAFLKLANLEKDRCLLNSYAEQVFSVVMPLGKSIYEANGILANLSSYRDIIFHLNNVRRTNRDQFIHYVQTLEDYCNTVGELSTDPQANPWQGCTIASLNNEFRRDIASKSRSLLSELEKHNKRINEIFAALYSSERPSLNGIREVIISLNGFENAKEIPYDWISEDSLPLKDEIVLWKKNQSDTKNLMETVLKSVEILSGNGIIESIGKEDLRDPEKLETLERTAFSTIAYKEPFFRWSKDTHCDTLSLFTEAKNKAEQIILLKNKLLEQYDNSVFEINYEEIWVRFNTEYTGFGKYFKKAYKEDKKAFQVCRQSPRPKLTDGDILETISDLRLIASLKKWFYKNEYELNHLFADAVVDETSDYESVGRYLSCFSLLVQLDSVCPELRNKLEEYNENEETLKDHFGFYFNGLFTDWSNIMSAWNWAESFKEIIYSRHLTVPFIKKICSSVGFASDCLSLKKELSDIESSIRQDKKWFTAMFEDSWRFDDYTLQELQNWIESCVNNLSLLEELIDYRRAKERCASEGLGEVITAMEKAAVKPSNIIPVFEKRFYSLWLDSVLPEYPAVLDFRRKTQEKTIEEFAELDKSQFTIARARIKNKLINDLPSLEHFSTGQDEVSVLKRELAKTRKIMPVRKLFKEIPNLLLTLKPCLMMSPLSVSLFLEAETYKFDTVIFDEASQVRTENAIGAIIRGKQVIIAGDSKQLPPTNFFQATSSDSMYDDDDEDDDIDAYDSILDEANGLPERTLRWHYRSRQEDLIAFSNSKIYKNRLITFPSNIERGKDSGVEYIYVPDGFYDRGGRKGNIPEAEKVAKLVFEHFRSHPERSLGVIAFGETQQIAIENALRTMRLEHQGYEQFFNDEKDEAFFVKNLENVQGDERDTIIFSIGYAKDAAGKFRNQFGPLGKSGGERRLNVAITRASYNVKLVGSRQPYDIDEDAISSEGPKLLKAYIDYAINGPESLAGELSYDNNLEFDSPFEEAVYSYLKKKGYKLTTQVGCSSYRIDIGVQHPTLSGVFVLGIECDGASYHSAKTARERDRLRQDVLENMGWNIYRVWSTDWIKDPVTEGQLLVDAIEKAIKSFKNKPVSTTTETVDDLDNYVVLENERKKRDQLENPYGFDKYIKTNFREIPYYSNNKTWFAACVQALVDKEFPIHYDYLCQRVAPLLGNEKATVKVRREVDQAIAGRHGMIIRRGDFLYPYQGGSITVRLPNNRKSQYISADEFAAAMICILKTYIGATRKTICDETARVYGFASTGSSLASTLNEAVDILIRSGKIKEVDNKLSVIAV